MIRRAADRCEYCGLAQEGQEATFHIDHVKPLSAGGKTASPNLALACAGCSLRKGAREFAEDPETGEAVPLFNPRRDRFWEHFSWRSPYWAGLTPVGRATIEALA